MQFSPLHENVRVRNYAMHANICYSFHNYAAERHLNCAIINCETAEVNLCHLLAVPLHYTGGELQENNISKIGTKLCILMQHLLQIDFRRPNGNETAARSATAVHTSRQYDHVLPTFATELK